MHRSRTTSCPCRVSVGSNECSSEASVRALLARLGVRPASLHFVPLGESRESPFTSSVVVTAACLLMSKKTERILCARASSSFVKEIFPWRLAVCLAHFFVRGRSYNSIYRVMHMEARYIPCLLHVGGQTKAFPGAMSSRMIGTSFSRPVYPSLRTLRGSSGDRLFDAGGLGLVLFGCIRGAADNRTRAKKKKKKKTFRALSEWCRLIRLNLGCCEESQTSTAQYSYTRMTAHVRRQRMN